MSVIKQTPLEHAIMELISDHDLDGYILTRFDTKIVESLPEGCPQTAALMYDGGRFFIRFVEEWFCALTEPQRVAVLKHEIGHFVLKHMSRRTSRDPHIWNVACDMIINQELSNIPTDAIKLTDGYPAHEPAEVYYDRLLKEQKQNQKQGNGSGNGEGNPKTSDRNDPGNNSGKTGTGKQDHSGGIPKQWDSVMDAPVLGENDVESMTDDILRETIKERLNAGDSAEKLRGLHAGALADYVDDLTKPPIINWKHAITRFVTSLSDSHTRNTLKKPDRRNLTPYGKKKEYLPALIICIDTSGSVSNELLAEFFSQIVYLGRIVSEIDIIIADAEVHDHFVYKKGMEPQLKKRGYGRGGTDFDPAVQYINRNLRDKDGAIYLTDGYCPVPTTKCALPMIWVVTDNETFEGRPRIMAKTKESNR